MALARRFSGATLDLDRRSRGDPYPEARANSAAVERGG
jgi:hypothetical protein